MILIGLGSNLANTVHPTPLAVVEAALAALPGAGIDIRARSSWYRSAPVPAAAQPWYVNGVAWVATGLAPAALLDRLLALETRFGRRRSVANAARILDLDLLDHDGAVIATPRLALPHPRLAERRFVLAPLAELAPAWRHPVSGLGAAELLDRLPPGQAVERLAE